MSTTEKRQNSISIQDENVERSSEINEISKPPINSKLLLRKPSINLSTKYAILIASFISHMIADGIVFSYGVFAKEYMFHFRLSRLTVCWISSIFVALTLSLAPLANYLLYKFNHRTVTIAGSILSIIGFTAPYFYNELWFLILNSSVISGIGFGLIYLPSIAIVNVWFDKLKPLAIGIAISGSGFGTFIFNLLFEYLIFSFGLKYTMIITGGILLILIPCSLAYQPIRIEKKLNSRQNLKENSIQLIANNQSKNEKNTENNSVDRKLELNISISESKPKLKGFNSKSSMLEIMRHPIVWLLLFSNILSGIGFNSPYVFTKERAILLGVPANESRFLISTIGIGNCLGRVGFGFLATLKTVNRFHLYNVSLVVSGLILALMRWINNYIFMVAHTTIYGLMTGSFVTLTSVILLDIFGKHSAQKVFALSLASQGIAALIGPPFILWMYSKNQSFDLAFTICGILMMISGIIKYFSYISKEFRGKNFH